MTLGNAGCEKGKETGFLAPLHRRLHLWEETRFLTAARSTEKPIYVKLTISTQLTVMTIPSELNVLINRLNAELDVIEAQGMEGLRLLRPIMSSFPDNTILIQHFAYLNTILFFVQSSRKQISDSLELIADATVSKERIQECGEMLSNLLGKVIEVKLKVETLVNRWRR